MQTIKLIPGLLIGVFAVLEAGMEGHPNNLNAGPVRESDYLREVCGRSATAPPEIGEYGTVTLRSCFRFA